MKNIVLYGPPLSGKATLMRALANLTGSQVEPFAAGEGEDDVWDRGLRVDCAGHSACAVTVSGGVWNKSAWPNLLARASVLLVVLDPQESRLDVDRGCVSAVLQLQSNPRVCLVFTKMDLVSSRRCEEALEELLTAPSAGKWPRFHTTTEAPETMNAPLAWAFDCCEGRQ